MRNRTRSFAGVSSSASAPARDVQRHWLLWQRRQPDHQPHQPRLSSTQAVSNTLHRRQDALLAKDAQTASAVGGRASCSATAEWVHLSCILGTPLLSSASPSKDQGFASPRLPYELLALRTTGAAEFDLRKGRRSLAPRPSVTPAALGHRSVGSSGAPTHSGANPADRGGDALQAPPRFEGAEAP